MNSVNSVPNLKNKAKNKVYHTVYWITDHKSTITESKKVRKCYSVEGTAKSSIEMYWTPNHAGFNIV